ncbi:MAG: tetratricopeptide repeat protein [Candidatus Krumholzibacteriota bacterium]|nr:tetratricopeptide repeat protein [Candidatus Krumholzibacteriota bacterium]
MFSFFSRSRDLTRALSIFLTMTFLFSIAPVCAQEPEDRIFAIWEEIGLLRARGDYGKAEEILEQVLIDYVDDEFVLRRAWNLLVHTRFKMNDDESAMETARMALERFPDLTVNTAILPASMNDTYDELRSSMYGSLEVTGPEGAVLFLDADSLGTAPVKFEYIRTGMYLLTASKKGYHSRADTVRIDPSETLTFGMTLDRRKDTRWWLYRIVPAAAAVALIIYLTRPDNSSTPVEQPLPWPPDPPQ